MKKLAFVLFPLILCAIPLHAQNAVPVSASQIDINLGQSAVALTGPWRFHIGDNPQWSEPGFDDSSWETVDLGKNIRPFDPNQGTKDFVPGWTAKGHPGYSGYAWYRLRIHITGADGPLAFLASTNVDDSYQLFVNNHLIGNFGDFSGSVPTIYSTRPLIFALPASLTQNAPEGDLVLAFRFYMAPRTLLQIDPGGMHDPPFIGYADALNAAWHVAEEVQVESLSSALASALLFGLFTLLILMLYVFDRTETIVLLPLAACALSAIFLLLTFLTNTSQFLTTLQFSYLLVVLVATFRGLWLLTWWAYFGLQNRKWIRNLVFVIALWSIASGLLFEFVSLRGTNLPHSFFLINSVNNTLLSAATLLLLVLVAWFGIRQSQRLDWMLILAVIFYGLPELSPIFPLLHLRVIWFPFGINIQLDLITSLLSLFCFSFVLMRRFRASQRRQQATLEDVKQAQEVQQVLIPEELPRVPGLAIESEYRPAREVGGDFFQIIPNPTNGSALIVAGDVTGKGLKAGMLVAVLVGAIRSTIELNPDPVFLLQALNRRLTGRGDAHATCLAMRIASDGSVRLANAGHLPPYLNGKPLSVDGALPLGFVPDLEPSVTSFKLNEGDRLVLVSDGIAEAMDAEGHLFGFDRVEQMLAAQHGKVPPSTLAEAAQKFGQEDDISVIAVTRQPVLQTA
jgi:hypothetical protein